MKKIKSIDKNTIEALKRLREEKYVRLRGIKKNGVSLTKVKEGAARSE